MSNISCSQVLKYKLMLFFVIVYWTGNVKKLLVSPSFTLDDELMLCSTEEPWLYLEEIAK